MGYALYLFLGVVATVVVLLIVGYLMIWWVRLLDQTKLDEARPNIFWAMVWLAVAMITLRVTVVAMMAVGYAIPEMPTMFDLACLIVILVPTLFPLWLHWHYLERCPHVLWPFLQRKWRERRGSTSEV